MQLSLLESLPDEVLRQIFRHCDLPTLLQLSATNRALHEVITLFLPSCTRSRYNYDPQTLRHLGFHTRAPVAQRALWAERTTRRWREWDGRGAVIGGANREWRRCLPTLKIWDIEDGVGAVLVAKGRELECWITRQDGTVEIAQAVVRPPKRAQSRQVPALEGAAQQDVTALAVGPQPGEIIVSRVSGVVQRLRLVEHAAPGYPFVLEEVARYTLGSSKSASESPKTGVHAIHARANLLVAAITSRQQPLSHVGADLPVVNDPRGPIASLALTLKQRSAAQSHNVSIQSISSPWQSAKTIPFPTKPWSVHLSPFRSWLAVGHSGTAPLSVFQLDSTGAPIAVPSQIAHTSRSTSVYGLTTPSPHSSLFSNPEQTLIAAFYDATTRVYDLRVPSFGSPSDWDAHASDARPPNEVVRLVDPWSDDPCYSVGIGGAMGSYVAVGSARNAAVRLFDIRSPARPSGITAFAPGRDRSPIYALEMEGSRVWGCTENRGFVLDFEAFEAPRRRTEPVAYVSHQDGEGGTLRWMGDHRI